MKILLAVDGSLCSDAAITEVATRPWPIGSSVVILYVVHSRVPQIPDPFFSLYAAHEQSLEEEQESGQRRVEDAAERIRQNPTIDFVDVETIANHRLLVIRSPLQLGTVLVADAFLLRNVRRIVVRRLTGRTDPLQRRGALGAKLASLAVLVAATWTLHH